MVEILDLFVVYTFDWLTAAYPEGAKFGGWPSLCEFGKGAFGGFRDLEAYGGMLLTSVPWGIAHAMPLVYGRYGVTGLAHQADPPTVGYGAPAMEIPFGTTMLAHEDQLWSGSNTLPLEDVVAFLCALLFLCKFKEGVRSVLLQPRCTSSLLDVLREDLSSSLM